MVAVKTYLKLFFALIFTTFFFSSVSFAAGCMDGYIDFYTGDSDDACHNIEGWNSTNGEDKWMSLNANQYVDLWTDYPGEAHTLTFKHYDGLCDDSFNLYVNEQNLFSYDHGTGTGAITEEVNVPAYLIDSNTVALRFRNLAADTCGHAGIDWINLEQAGGSLLQNGEACDYSSECGSENCLHGICCEYGQVCCETSDDCPSGEECGDYYYCEAQPCCGTKNLCDSCTIDSDCISGYCKKFDDNKYRCTTSVHPDVGCCPDGHHMEHPVVGTDCCTTAGCGSGETCVNYKCVSGGGGGIKELCEQCTVSSECKQGYCFMTPSTMSKCMSNGFVYAVDCCSNSDCAAGKTCVSGKCTVSGGGSITSTNCTTQNCQKTIQCLGTVSSCLLSIGTMIPCVKSTLTGVALASDACELAARKQSGDYVGVFITGIFTALDIEDAVEEIIPCSPEPVTETKDIIVGTLSCLEGIIYSALDDCGGYYGCYSKIIQRLKEMKESAVAVFVGSPVDVKINGMYLEDGEIKNRPAGAFMLKTPNGETIAILTKTPSAGNVNIELKGSADIPLGEYGNYSITKAVISKGLEVSLSTTAGSILQGETKTFSMSVPAGFGRKVGGEGGLDNTSIMLILAAFGGGAVLAFFMMKGKGSAMPQASPRSPRLTPQTPEVKPASTAKPIVKKQAQAQKAVQQPKQSKNVCKNCGAPRESGAAFCTKCGKKL